MDRNLFGSMKLPSRSDHTNIFVLWCLALLVGIVILSTPGNSLADFNVTVSINPSTSGSWSGAIPDIWSPTASGANVSVTEIQTRLNAGTSVVVETSAGGSESGDVTVNSPLSWNISSTLMLSSLRNVTITSNITATGASAGLVLTPGGGGRFTLKDGAVISLSGATPSLSIAGNSYVVINDLSALQSMHTNLSGYFALGSNIDATPTSGWNAGAGFVPVGNNVTPFTGSFDGLGHTINGLTINRPSTNFIGLFGYIGTGSAIRNVGLTGANITGSKYVGSLIGINSAGIISNSYSVGSVAGTGGGYSEIGGLVGENSSSGSIANCYTSGTVTGTGGGYAIGGLVGINYESSIDNSYSTSTVSGSANDVGGLVGNTYLSGSISNSYSAGAVSGGGSYIGALVGWNNTQHTVSNCYSSSSVNGTTGNLIGNGAGIITNSSLLSAPQMTSKSSFPTWDFTNVWWMNDGLSSPKLRSILYVPAGFSTSGLASIWRAEGNTLDNIGNNHGTLSGGAGYAAGTLGSAFTFDGDPGSYMTVPASSTWAFGTGDFSIGFWVYGTTNDTKRPLINNRKTGASENMWAIEIYTVANRVEFHSGLSIYLTASNLINSSSWNHVAVTRSGTTLSMYINGVLSGSASVPNDFSEINDLQIGRDVMAGNQLGNTFAGSLDEIVIFNRALTAFEVSSMVGTSPNQFSFVPQTGMPLSTVIVSDPPTITGLTYPAAISVSGGEYSIGCTGTFTSTPGTISNGSTVCVRQTSSSGYSTKTTATVTVGGVSAGFDVTTAVLGDPTALGLISWWRGENNTLDSVVGSHGTPQGGAGYAPGRVGQTFSFDGIDDYVSIPATASVNGNGPGAVQLWFKANTVPSGVLKYGYLYSQAQTSSGADIRIYLYGDGTLNFVGYDGRDYQFNLKIPFSDTSSWHHVVGTWSATDTRFYLDGILIGSDSAINMGTFAPDEVTIGSGRFANSYINGLVDEVKLFNRDLSSIEVGSLSGMVPDQFSFIAQTGMPLGVNIVSSPATITGLTYPAAINVSGGEYSIGCTGTFTSTPGTISNGSTVCVRQTSSSGYSTKTTATVTVGGVSAGFDVTTAALGDPTALGLISWWRGENNALDAIGGNHGTAQNGAEFAAGRVGRAFRLDGTNDVITAPAFDMGADWSVAGWFSPSACSSIGVCPLFARSTGNTEGLLLAYLNQNFSTPSNRGRFVFDIGDGSTWQIEGYSSSVFSDNAWHHVVISKSGDTYAMHVDGQPQYQTTVVGVSTVYQTHGIQLGHWSYGSGETYTSGGIDEVMVFNRPLSAKEVFKLINPGLVARWRADNNALDSAGDNDGVWSGTATYADGKSGQAFSFDGTGTRIDIASQSGEFGANPFSVAFWIKDSGGAYPSDGYIIGKSHPDGGLGWDIRIKDGQIKVVGVNGWGFNITSDFSLTQGVWHHVALSATGTEVSLFVDGILKGTSQRGTITTTSNPLRFGFATNYGEAPFSGLLDEVSIYNRALSSTEVIALFQPGVVSWWRGEGDALDSLGVNNGTIVGNATFASGINGGQAFNFNGSDSFIQVATPGGLPTGVAPRTVAGWIKSAGPTNGTKYQTIFGYGSPGIDGGTFLLEWGGEVNDRRLYLTGWNRDLAGSSQLSYGQWYHVAAVYDGNTVRLYVNGIEDASAPRSMNTVIGSNFAGIGNSPPNDGWHSFFNGLIDDLSMFDRALGATEIATLSGMVPDQFSFAPVVSVPPGTIVDSSPATITGLTNPTSISIGGGEYSIGCTGTFTSATGTISNGSTVCVRQTSSGSYGTTTTATLTVGGVSAVFTVKTRNSVIGSAPGGNGSISCTSPVDEHGQSICSITPDVGYHLDTLTDNGLDVIGSVSQSDNYTIADITGNHDIIAGYAINIYTVAATAGANGTISPSGTMQYQHGSTTSLFTVTPGDGYHVLAVKKDGEDIMVEDSAGFVAPAFSAIAAGHAIDAAFTANLSPGPARIVSPQDEYQTLQDAYATVFSGGEILLLATLPEGSAFFASQPKNVRISGGYGSGYSPTAGDFTILGHFSVSAGKVLLRGVKIR